MRDLTNSEDPECDISSGSILFDICQNNLQRKEIITCDPSVYTMDLRMRDYQ